MKKICDIMGIDYVRKNQTSAGWATYRKKMAKAVMKKILDLYNIIEV